MLRDENIANYVKTDVFRVKQVLVLLQDGMP